MAAGDTGALREYNNFQVQQLTRLIEVTRTNLTKPQRQKVGPRGCAAVIAAPHALTTLRLLWCKRLCAT